VVASSVRVAGLITAVASTLFILGLFATPKIISQNPEMMTHRHSIFPKINKVLVPSGILLGRYREELAKEVAKDRRRQAKMLNPTQRIVGFFAPWMDTSMASLRANVGHLTHLMPQWLRISPDGQQIIDKDYDPLANPKNQEAIDLCSRNHVKIFPILSNTNNDNFDQGPVVAMFSSPARMKFMAVSLRKWLTSHNMDGLNVDLENLSPKLRSQIPDFLLAIHLAFVGTPLDLTCDIEADTPLVTIGKMANACNFVVLMTYDEHGELDSPGPIAGINWTQTILNQALSVIPLDKLVLGMGAYSYDWQQGTADAETDSYEEALTSAKSFTQTSPQKTMLFDPVSLNTYFQYADEDGDNHTVWMEDALSTYNQWRVARDVGVNGFALWALGQEDPTVWKILDRDQVDVSNPANELARLHYPFSVENVGKGEILTVKYEMEDGLRSLTLDPDSKLITNSVYQDFPSAFVIQHSGYIRKDLALTFDDGPDPTYTIPILKILQEKNVPATFFFIGKNIENNPGICKQVFTAGEEIGNHTFFHPNLGLVSDWRVNLELNATQRSIQTITGRSTKLFRPPYNADRDPATPIEVIPVDIANKMGYLTVGESIDPRDWDPFTKDPVTGAIRTRSVADIVNDTISGVASNDVPENSTREGGNCILLHDAGGNREKTVEALPQIIDTLRAKGYKFVPISSLIHETRDQIMPPLSSHEKLLILLDGIAFRLVFGFLDLLAVCFIGAIVLGFLRILIVFPLALTHERKMRKVVYSSDYHPSVSVLIAAFNEERVIVQTVQSILQSQDLPSEIVVVDDGSTDHTYANLKEAFGETPNVKVLTQENSGKSGALNHAIQESIGEILVCVDADTILSPSAISLLVRHFEDPKIGAVAGNVQVGNAYNPLTIWQSVEYTTSQNIDRRALAFVNAVTVVPGAIGAWRRTAIDEAGGHSGDTLAEDMDLTWRVRMQGWLIETESNALAFTEAPESVRAFARQRFRWAFGTLQCLFKHHDAIAKFGFFGRLALPMLWIFQVVFQILAPLIDLEILIALIGVGFALGSAQSSTMEVSPLVQAASSLSQAAFLYALFFLVELISGVVAYRLEHKPLGQLWWLFLQRFVYRQIMYFVVLRAIRTAIKGVRQGWGKLDRTATVRLGGAGRLH